MALLAFGALIAKTFSFRNNEEEPESIFGELPPETPRCTAIIPSVPAPHPIPSRQISQGTLIFQTPDGWCEIPAALPIGVPCGRSTFSGPVGGITVPSRP